ncbi:MAG: class I SAM-dependent methyltransferase [Deltaproteobacteria bacterium]|nr:class I SAM-dependent methyltransferase [Deltaproteobacteria bacterium]
MLSDLVIGVQKHWSQLRPILTKRLDEIYCKSGSDEKVDTKDQAYFLSALYLLVRILKPQHIIQTGTLVGHSAVAMGLAMKDFSISGVIETIDPEPSRYGGAPTQNPVDIARNAVKFCDLEDNIKFHRGYSYKAGDTDRMDLTDAPENILQWLAQKQVSDVCVIDGDHTYNGTFWDMEFGWKALKKNGSRLLVIHDYSGIPNVRSAVRDWRNMAERRGIELIFRAWFGPSGFAMIWIK